MTRRLLPLFIALFAMLAGCHAGPSDEAVAGVARELQADFPNQIAEIDWENAPPLDPPTIFIDLHPGPTESEVLAMLCNEIKPRVVAAHPDIDVRLNGLTMSGHCP